MQTPPTRRSEKPHSVSDAAVDPAVATHAISSSAAPQPADEPGRELGRFLVLGVLGSGGMGVVYEAYDPQLDRRVALKRVRVVGDPKMVADRRARLIREARALAPLSHPNVITVYDVIAIGDDVLVAMELVDGVSLRQWAGAARRSWRDVARVLRKAGDGLAAAHDAGVVHRDVKPDNVLVTEEGRVIVVDFGLARTVDDDRREMVASNDAALVSKVVSHNSAELAATPVEPRRTAVGVLMGTPAYMAPEIYEGGRGDEATDQFAFFVMAYELLYGQRPFAGRDLETLEAAIKAARLPRPPTDAVVPAWLARVVRRGLQADPARRFASMHTAVTALSRDPTRHVKRGAGLAALAVVPAAFVAGYLADAPCEGGRDRVAEAWSASKGQHVVDAFGQTGLAFAPSTGDAVARDLDAYARSWTDAYREVCEATHVRGEQSEAMLDRRMSCLDDRRRDLDALVGTLQTPDVEAVVHAEEAVAGLEDPAHCVWLDASADGVAHLGEQDRRHVDEAARLLASARARIALHDHRDGLGDLGAARSALRELEHPRLRAEIALAEGVASKGLSELDRAVEAFAAAQREAEAAGDDRLRLRAMIEMLVVEGAELSSHASARRVSADAKAVLRRLDHPAGLHAEYLVAEGRRLQDAGNPGDALAHYEQALALANNEAARTQPVRVFVAYAKADLARYDEAETMAREVLDEVVASHGPDHPATLTPRDTLATILGRQGRWDEMRELVEVSLAILHGIYGDDHLAVAAALHKLGVASGRSGDLEGAQAELERAIAIRAERLGKDHPRVADSVNTLGVILKDAGRLDEAQGHLERALNIRRRALSPDDPDIALTATNLASLRSRRGEREAALELYDEALSLRERTLGPDHPDVAFTLMGKGITLQELERFEDADAALRRALAIREASFGPQHPWVGIVAGNLGVLALARQQWDEAETQCRRSLEIKIAARGPEHPDLAYAFNCIGEAMLRRGRVSEAEHAFRRSLQLLEQTPDRHALRGEASYGAARASWELGRRRDALALAEAAIEAYRAYGKGREAMVEEIRTWRASLPR